MQGSPSEWYTIAQYGTIVLGGFIITVFLVSYYLMHVIIARHKSFYLNTLTQRAKKDGEVGIGLNELDNIRGESATKLLLHATLLTTARDIGEWPLSKHSLLDLIVSLSIPYIITEFVRYLQQAI